MKVIMTLSMIVVVLGTFDAQNKRWEHKVSKRSSTKGTVLQRYYFSNFKANWTTAEDYCVKYLDGHLTTIQDKEENEFIRNQANKRNMEYLWTGARRNMSTEHDFKWNNKETFSYSNWGVLQPDFDGGDDCVFMHLNGDWDDNYCGIIFSFVCKV